MPQTQDPPASFSLQTAGTIDVSQHTWTGKGIINF